MVAKVKFINGGGDILMAKELTGGEAERFRQRMRGALGRSTGAGSTSNDNRGNDNRGGGWGGGGQQSRGGGGRDDRGGPPRDDRPGPSDNDSPPPWGGNGGRGGNRW